MIYDATLSEEQQRCIPDVSFELIPISNLVSNQEYQRPLSSGQIRRALEEFNIYQINPVKVSRRDEINYVFDGQHTCEIIAAASGSRDTPVWCMVFDGCKLKVLILNGIQFLLLCLCHLLFKLYDVLWNIYELQVKA